MGAGRVHWVAVGVPVPDPDPESELDELLPLDELGVGVGVDEAAGVPNMPKVEK
jgi:hypothetical protein